MSRAITWPHVTLRGRRLLLACLLPLMAALAGGAHAQSSLPSEEQLEILRNLTPEQREQILRQLGGDALDPAGRRARGREDERDRLEDREGRSEVERRLDRQSREALERLERRMLQPEDTLLLQIDFPRPRQAQDGAAVPPGVVPGDPRFPAVPGTVQTTDRRALPAEQQIEREPPLTDTERRELETLRDRIRARNPYRLDRNGVLFLAGFGPEGIALAGLTERQVTLRVQAEPAFRRLQVEVIRLPLKPIGAEALRPFGYDLFDGDSPSTFAPVTNVPVPADYVVGSGDELDVQLYGNQNRSLSLVVRRDGRVSFPGLGPIAVGGQRFTRVKSDIEARVERQMIGVRANVSMGETRSIRVFVLGDAKHPGSYTVSGLATVTSALYAAGGIRPIGSLRDIQLKRQGEVIRRLDLYDLLIHGDTSDDARLLPGDAIFIPPIGPTVSVTGEVRRPAVYELKGETTVAELLRLAGGLTPEADAAMATVSRIDEQGRRVVVAARAPGAGATSQPLRAGDLLRVPRLRPQLDSGVLVQGHVHRSGPAAWRDGLRLTDVIASVDELRPNADPHYVIIRRESPVDRQVSVLSADLGAALQNPGSAADVALMPRDQITVFDLQSGRERVIRPLLDELRLHSSLRRPPAVVQVAGRVKVPGEYPLEPNMRVSDLIRAGGSLEAAAYGGTAELTRYRVVGGEARRTELVKIDLAAVLQGDPAADLLLEPFDYLNIQEMPDWGTQERVTLLGEVRFPGVYPIKRGETLQSVLERAGGLTDYAYPAGSVFTREDLKQREQEQLDQLGNRLQSDLATLALQGAAANQAQAGTALQVGQQLLAQLQTSEAVGRLVIDLERALVAPRGSGADVILRDGDRLMVPQLRQEVTVLGEVQNATSHFYRPELGRNDYISMSGGVTRKADTDKIYVVRANGSVLSGEGRRWFRFGARIPIQPGDTIVVPLDTERLPALPFWQSVTSIIYNLAISAAAVNSF